MYTISKSTANQVIYIRLFNSSDHITPQTGVTAPTVTISKNGGAFASPSDGTWAELGSGVYTVTLDATDTGTLGPLATGVSKAGVDDAVVVVWVGIILTNPVQGSGADQVTMTFTKLDLVTPIPDADVWITSDEAGNVVVAGTLQTDSNGQAMFLLDDGNTYYMWGQKDGYESLPRGEQFTAVAD